MPELQSASACPLVNLRAPSWVNPFLRAFASSRGILLLLLLLLLTSCDRDTAPQVVLYTSIDQPMAAVVVRAFEAKTGVRVVLVTDTEATKSIGLAERLRAERDNVQADVWWGNEPFHTIRLADEGLFEPYPTPGANDVPDLFKDPQHRWTGNGIRARVLAGHEMLDMNAPMGLNDLLNPELRGKVALARPVASTTGGHVGALYVLWGEEKFDAFFRALHANELKVLGGNSNVAQAVGDGTITLGLTDNDDVANVRAEGGKLNLKLPDQQDGQIGTLAIPTTVALVRGARQPELAKQLIDYLVSNDVEQQMLDAKYFGWRVRDTSGARWMKISYIEVASVMPTAVRRAAALLEGREP